MLPPLHLLQNHTQVYYCSKCTYQNDGSPFYLPDVTASHLTCHQNKAVCYNLLFHNGKLMPHSEGGNGHRLATDLSLFSKVLSGRKCLFEEQTHNTAEDGKGKDERGHR